MKNLTLENIAKACDGKLFLLNGDDAEKEAKSVIIDSRKCEENCVFIATKGERVDGHSFINQVWENGALAVICEDIPENVTGNYICVKNSFKALKDIGNSTGCSFQQKLLVLLEVLGRRVLRKW